MLWPEFRPWPEERHVCITKLLLSYNFRKILIGQDLTTFIWHILLTHFSSSKIFFWSSYFEGNKRGDIESNKFLLVSYVDVEELILFSLFYAVKNSYSIISFVTFISFRSTFLLFLNSNIISATVGSQRREFFKWLTVNLLNISRLTFPPS